MKFFPREYRLLIGVHTHGSITPPFAQSLAVLTATLATWGVAHAVSIVQDAFVTSGRDKLANACVEEDFTHLLFLDADLQFDPQDVAALFSAHKDVVAGAYRKKNETGQFALSVNETAEVCAETGAVAVEGVGTGFMLIRREVFVRMAQAMPEIAFIDGSDGAEKKQHAFFEQRILPSGHRASEDILFCHRWRGIGGVVWVLPGLSLKHWGPACFEGAWIDQLRMVDVA